MGNKCIIFLALQFTECFRLSGPILPLLPPSKVGIVPILLMGNQSSGKLTYLRSQSQEIEPCFEPRSWLPGPVPSPLHQSHLLAGPSRGSQVHFCHITGVRGSG